MRVFTTHLQHNSQQERIARIAAVREVIGTAQESATGRTWARLGDDGSLPPVWLLAEWPPEGVEPTDYWLSTLPEGTKLADLVRLAKIRWPMAHGYRELKTALGFDHFEGRTWTGWHRHVSLFTAAQLLLTLLRSDPEAATPA